MKKPAASDLRDIARNLLVKRDENSLLVHPTESARSAVDRMFSDFHSQRALMKPVDAVPEAFAHSREPKLKTCPSNRAKFNRATLLLGWGV
jgi:hypothetical protein